MNEKLSTAAAHGAKKGKHVMGKLSARFVQTVKYPPKWHSDGAGLYLRVTKDGNKSWVFIFPNPDRTKKSPKEMGLGSYPAVSLESARTLASQARQDLRNGIDPIEKKKVARQAAAKARSKTMTFDQCADAYIESNRAGWKNEKHAQQWENTLKTYASPIIGKLPIADIDTGLVLKVLEPIWTAKPETASRLRGRLEAVLGWATVRGYRQGDNPAAWRNHLDKVLPARSAIAKVEHHPALPYVEIGGFIETLRTQAGVASRALEFAILTAARSGEVIGATWQEFDLDKGTWTIPAERMKAKKEHYIPLSSRALEIVNELLPLKTQDGDPVFKGKGGKAFSNMAMLAVLKRMKRADMTAHGFRSTFRDWAGETTAYPREVIEHALAHQLKDKAEAAYARGTLFDKRRKLMDAWAAYCNTVATDATVTPINGKTAA